MLRSQHHKGGAEQGVRTGGEHFQINILAIDFEDDGGTHGLADPVALHFFHGLAPFHGLQTGEQPFGVCGDAEQPLFHRLAHHGVAATDGETVDHLVVGQHGTEFRAPVHQGFGLVGEAVVHQHFLLLLFAHGFPLVSGKAQRLALGHVKAFGAFLFEAVDQLADGLGFLATVAIERVEQLEEGPLGPFIIGRIRGAHFAVPVVTESDLVHLLAVAVDVLLGSYSRVSARLNGILLRGKTVGIVTHRVQHIKAFQAFVTGVDVRGDIAQRVTHMQSCTGRIGEHVQNIEFRLIMVNINLIHFLVAPVLLPFFLDLGKIIIHRMCVF